MGYASPFAKGGNPEIYRYYHFRKSPEVILLRQVLLAGLACEDGVPDVYNLPDTRHAAPDHV
jgi:hypothetical protein